jgi:hypothetical protein
LRLDRKWIKGYGARIYYYRYFDANEKMMDEVNVFDLDPASFALIHEIVAARARWNPSLKTWVFEDGWSAQFQGTGNKSYAAFHGPLQPVSFPALTEPPEYFLKEATRDQEMNFLQLDHYIADLTQSVRAGIRTHHGADRISLRLHGGQPRRHGRHRRQYFHRDFISGARIAI